MGNVAKGAPLYVKVLNLNFKLVTVAHSWNATHSSVASVLLVNLQQDTKTAFKYNP